MARGRALGCFFAAVFSVAAGQSEGELKALFENQRWFQLRDAAAASGGAAFYKGVVSCVFDDVRRAEKSFREVLRRDARSEEAFQAHGLLASAYMRAGNYARTLAHLDEMQRLKPEYEGLAGSVALLRALSKYPRLAVVTRRASDVQMTSDMFIPLKVNGRPALYGFDTGMDVSVISQMEARRLGLEIHGVSGSEIRDGASGNRIETRYAMAKQLTVGNVEIENVAFLVAGDDALPFSELPPDRQGIIGFPVVRAFRTVRWDRKGLLQIAFRQERRPGRANMCIPGIGMPVLEGRFEAESINIALDTGNGRTVLTPRFLKDFGHVAGKSAKKERTELRGLGGATGVDVISLPEIKFRTGGFGLLLRPAQVLPQDSRVDRDSYHVWLGMDLLGQASRVTLDFGSMRFLLE